jgi:cytochrome P450
MSIVRLRIPGLEFGRGLAGRELMMDFFGSMISAKRTGADPDLFSRLCRAESEEGDRYSDAEIVDHLIFLMMAAHDTTTSTLTSIAYELARRPEWQERARAECARFSAPTLSYDQLGELPTLDMVMYETLRRYPPLSTIPRMSERAFEFGGYEIPAGVMVVIYPIHTHHMGDWWTAPYRFDPERFSEARGEQKRHSHSFVPFGGGAHMCLGYRFAELQIKAVLYQLLRRYRWSVPAGYEMPVQQAPISKPRDGLPVTLERLA